MSAINQIFMFLLKCHDINESKCYIYIYYFKIYILFFKNIFSRYFPKYFLKLILN